MSTTFCIGKGGRRQLLKILGSLGNDCLWILEPVRPMPRWRIDNDELNGAVVGDALPRRRPVHRGQVGAYLQVPPGRWRRPINLYRVRGRESDTQSRRARCLHGEQRPETARERITATGHRAASVVLTDGAAEGIDSARTAATATGDFVPVD